ncbi:MAG: hypothetical protein E7519_15935 [Ruminococcaceae bacterium]|nr:hypothetical protein [Oscillospiraceae bacterium]
MEDLEKLAERVFATTDLPDRPKTCNYYMLNIAHPVIAELKRRFCVDHGIHCSFPMSDQERTLFELQLMNGGMLKEIEKFCEADEARRAAEKKKESELDH